ncbi:zinc finger protein [Gigaspora margarita]|uniref:Zinc finger protein n=1 Tax=Gigaspora margarita TaxID=4874 RepID=A0A8H4A1M9_GIGMA|nr:zinc finger protein [Gigaspora margarita]
MMFNTLDKYFHSTESSEPDLNNQNLPKQKSYNKTHHLAIEVFLDLIELTNLQIQNKTELVYNKSPITVSPSIFGPKRVISNTVSELLLNNQVSNYAIYNNSKAGANFLYAIAMLIEENILAKVQRSSS